MVPERAAENASEIPNETPSEMVSVDGSDPNGIPEAVTEPNVSGAEVSAANPDSADESQTAPPAGKPLDEVDAPTEDTTELDEVTEATVDGDLNPLPEPTVPDEVASVEPPADDTDPEGTQTGDEGSGSASCGWSEPYDPVEDIDDVLPQHDATGREVIEGLQGTLLGQFTIEETGEQFPVTIELHYIEGTAELTYWMDLPNTTPSTGAGATSAGSTSTGAASPESGSDPSSSSTAGDAGVEMPADGGTGISCPPTLSAKYAASVSIPGVLAAMFELEYGWDLAGDGSGRDFMPAEEVGTLEGTPPVDADDPDGTKYQAVLHLNPEDDGSYYGFLSWRALFPEGGADARRWGPMALSWE
jgi:hypothetical protein